MKSGLMFVAVLWLLVHRVDIRLLLTCDWWQLLRKFMLFGDFTLPLEDVVKSAILADLTTSAFSEGLVTIFEPKC